MKKTELLNTKPNIVMIVLDSVRRDHLSCYGHARETTPHIDRVAAKGVQFMRAYATSCWTIPTHASLFTGLYPSQHRADFDTKYLDPCHPTLAAYLKKCGYRTACISCNSFVGAGLTNLNNGFDFSIDVGGLRGGQGFGSKLVRYVQRHWRNWTRPDRGAQRATQLALDWLGERSHAEPFFLFLNYMDCHLPYRFRLPARYRFVAPADRRRVDRVPQDPFACMARQLTLSAQDMADLQALYDGCLFYLDQQVGVLDARLRELGLHERTIFIVTSDHGESFGEHGLLDHQYGLYEHLVAVPLVMRLPEGNIAGQKHHQLVQHVDVFPTIAHLVNNAGAEANLPVWSGCSMFEKPGRDTVLAEYLVPNLRAFRRRFPEADVARYDVAMRSIYTDGHKLIWRSDGRLELYDLEDDPAETTNLADVRTDLVDRLHARLKELLGPWPGLDDNWPEEEGLEEVRDRLEALGYF